MQREPVESTSLRSIGYDPQERTLEVEFNSGGVYRYLDVPPDTYRELRDNESIGRYFTRNVRNAFECWKFIRPPANRR